MVLSTGGAGLAVSGFTNQPATRRGPSTALHADARGHRGRRPNDVLGEEDSGGPAPEENGGPAGNEDENESQPARQVEAGAQASGEEQLPFTGFAAIPVLLGGVALLATGLVLRRRTSNE